MERVMSELKKAFDVTQVPYHKRYQTIDGIRWVMLEEANREIRSRESESPWVSVEERLPEELENYLVTDGSSWVEIVCYEDDRWSDFGKIITHWMPIPEVETDE